MSIGCIQAQRCHTGHCPAGVATQSRWLMRGLDPTHKAARLANFVTTLRKDLIKLSHACGVLHPALMTTDDFDVIDGRFDARSATEIFNYGENWGLPSEEDQAEICRIMNGETASKFDPSDKVTATS